ncbi:SCO2400 family protein [Streptomyces sp. NPDC001221]
MDYCSSCRRHLNGALVCPGCGAYAPDIAPPMTTRAYTPTTGAAMTGTQAREFALSGTWHDSDLSAGDAHPFDRSDDVDTPSLDPSDEVDGPRSAAPTGRAARRRQLARWKKNKRRAAVATAVAIVGGGLTVTALDRQSPDRAQAAAAPDNRSMGVAGEQTGADSLPETASPGTHRSAAAPQPSHTMSAAESSAIGTPHQQGLVTTPRTARPDTRPDSAAAPVAAQTMAAQPQTAAPASGGSTSTGSTGTSAQPPTASPSPSTTTGTTDPGTPQTNPSSQPTSPSHLCLLVVCLG